MHPSKLMFNVIGVEIEGEAFIADYSSLTLVDVIPKDPKAKSPFYLWLREQVGRYDIIGDLAGDMKDDKGFPSKTDNLVVLEVRILNSKGAISGAMQALREAYHEYNKKCKYTKQRVTR